LKPGCRTSNGKEIPFLRKDVLSRRIDQLLEIDVPPRSAVLDAIPFICGTVPNKSRAVLALHQKKNAITGLNVLLISESLRVGNVSSL